MKKIILFILFVFPVHLFAQDWNTIIPSDTNHFTVHPPAIDSMWEGYLRCAYVDSSISTGGVTTNYFYPSIRLDTNNNIDTTHGDTWLGNKNIRYSNGEELYFNKQGDTIRILTEAEVNDTWVFSIDSNYVWYVATLASKDTMTIDGTLDSIKTMNILAYFGTGPATSYYNNFTITFSKNHGFVSLFEFYGFPYCTNVIAMSSLGWSGTNSIGGVEIFYPVLPFIHRRLDSGKTNMEYGRIDNGWKYQPGNEWLSSSYHSYSCPYFSLIHDSVISASLLSPDSISVEIYRHRYWHNYVNCSNPGAYYDIGHSYDTLYFNVPTTQLIGLGNLKKKVTEYDQEVHTYMGSLNIIEQPHSIFVKPFCSSRIIVKDTSYHFQTNPMYETNEVISGFGKTISSHLYTVVGGHKEEVLYAKLGSCAHGTKFSFKTLAVNDIIDSELLLDIYPNPSNQHFIIEPKSALDISSIDLYDMQGKHLIKHRAMPKDKKIDVSNMTKGLYLLVIKTDKGLIRKIIQKE